MSKSKKFSIKNMSVKAKIVMFSVIMLLFMVVIAGVGLYASQNINQKRQARYDDYAMAQYYLSEAFTNFNDMKAVVRNQFIRFYAPGVERNYDEGKQNFEKYETAMEEQFEKFKPKLDVYNNKELTDKYNAMREILSKWIESCNKDVDGIVAAGDNTNKVNSFATDLMTNGVSLANEAKTKLTEVCELVQQESDENAEVVNNELAVLEGVLIGVSVVAFVITLAYALLLIRLITVPVAKVSAAAKQLAVGDVDVDCSKIADDDLGQLLDDFSMMVASIREQAEIAEQMADGDMTIHVEPRGAKDLLGKALEKLVSDTDRNLSNVKESTVQVTVGSDQVATASQALAQGATEQASALQQVTASVNEIAEHTKDNATQANQADELMNRVKDMAIAGNEQMKAMIAAMEDINESSETISKIIKTIDDIAFQTNILALNAAVEAARAGVHGKGFAVVAEEVRNLAAKSASAASETAEMIEDSIHKVGHGTELAESTAKALDEIAEGIDRGATLVAAIATSSNDQATAVSQVDQAIGQVSQVVQTNSATSEQCAAASEELSNQAANLRNLMAYYKLSGGKQLGGSMANDTIHEDSAAEIHSDNEQIISLNGEFGKY